MYVSLCLTLFMNVHIFSVFFFSWEKMRLKGGLCRVVPPSPSMCIFFDPVHLVVEYILGSVEQISKKVKNIVYYFPFFKVFAVHQTHLWNNMKKIKAFCLCSACFFLFRHLKRRTNFFYKLVMNIFSTTDNAFFGKKNHTYNATMMIFL